MFSITKDVKKLGLPAEYPQKQIKLSKTFEF